jgi:phosphoribosylformimino-5-aminoimidazole carboxamide ribotide isomerase
MRIIPAIDIIDGKCVRLTQGDYAQKKIYNEDPLEVAKAFHDAGLTYLHLVDLDGAKAGKVINWKVVETITKNTTLTVDFGGGIKTDDEIKKLFDSGIQQVNLGSGIRQVNLGSIAVKDKRKVIAWAETFGADKIILSADVKDEFIAIHGWQENSTLHIDTFIADYTAQGITYITCTDISTDGTLKGPNINLYKRLLQKFPSIKLVASGGVGSLDDVVALKETNVDGVIIGKAIYEQKIQIEQLSTFK